MLDIHLSCTGNVTLNPQLLQDIDVAIATRTRNFTLPTLATQNAVRFGQRRIATTLASRPILMQKQPNFEVHGWNLLEATL